MFKNKKADRMDPNTTDTLIGEGSLFEGKIKSQASIRVEGQIVGDIECEGDVTIGENGVARSNIKARNVVLAGKVYGNLQAKGMLTIRASGHLHGNLTAQELAIEAGGIFQGSSKMEEKPESRETQEHKKHEAASAQAGEAGATLGSW
jgi:cytoskeletal protein CcmA (bactofilin family)